MTIANAVVYRSAVAISVVLICYLLYTLMSSKDKSTSGSNAVGSQPTSASTPYDDDGKGDVRYLDRQDVTCFANNASGALQGFKLSQKVVDAGQIQYSYVCDGSKIDKSSCRTDHTAADLDGNGNPQFLDRHKVACNFGEALSQFKLKQPSGADKGLISYEYTCCPTKKSNCTTRTTTKTDSGWGKTGVVPANALAYGSSKSNTRFLDKHHVSCGDGEVLSSFQVQQPDGVDSNTLQYTYTCCS